MPTTITFNQLNVSVQPTDILYATELTSGQSGKNHSRGDEAPFAVGIITFVDHAASTIIVDTTTYPAVTLTASHYLFFSKDRRVGTSGILGYYAEVEYINRSKNQAEIFATGTQYAPSSK